MAGHRGNHFSAGGTGAFCTGDLFGLFTFQKTGAVGNVQHRNDTASCSAVLACISDFTPAGFRFHGYSRAITWGMLYAGGVRLVHLISPLLIIGAGGLDLYGWRRIRVKRG